MSTNRSIGIKPLTALSPSQNWAFFPMNEGGGDGTNSANVVANDSRATTLVDLPMSASGGTEWSTRNGWWSGNGTSQAFAQPLASDAGLTNVFEIGNGALLLCGQIRIATNTGRITMLHIGDWTGSTKYGVWLFLEASGTNSKIGIIIRDDSNTASPIEYTLNTIADNATLASATTWNIAILIDNTATKNVVLYVQDASDPNNAIDNSGGQTLASLGAVTLAGGGNGNEGLYVARNGTGTQQWWTGNMRRLLAVNYGTSVPSDLATNIIPAIFRAGCQPVWEME